MRSLGITALVHEGPMARAYLGSLKRYGLQPERIILMVNSRHASTGRPLGRWMPTSARRWYLRKHQEIAWNVWPKRIKQQYPWLVDSMAAGLSEICDDAQSAIGELAGTFEFENYCETFEQVVCTGYSDDDLAARLRNTQPNLFLYTGGGILPPLLLDIPGAKFLHVHPGFLPEVRGADGLLWSMLARGCPGASCFYLAPGIDTGELVTAADFPAITFDISGYPRPDDKTLYRAVYSFYDPLLRAILLTRTIMDVDAKLDQLASAPQDLTAGVTYHFMHDNLRRQSLEKLFCSS